MPDQGACEFATRRPAPELASLISHYAGFRYQGWPPGTLRGLPSRYLTLIIAIDAPIRVLGSGAMGSGCGRFNAFVAGLAESASIIAKRSEQTGLHLFLEPRHARRLLGLPSRALYGQLVNLSELLGPAANELQERLAATRDWQRRFDVVDEVLARRARAARDPPAALDWAWRRITASDGRVPIARLAAQVGFSRRYLHRRFVSEVGLSPKAFARICRFEHAARLLKSARLPLAVVAADSGFCDQAHLSREWRRIAGCPPRAWIAEESPFVQDYELAGWED